MRQRLNSEIDLTRIGECLLSNNNRLITCDRTCDKKSWDGGRIDANIWLLNYPRLTLLKRTRMLSNAFEWLEWMLSFKLNRGIKVLGKHFFKFLWNELKIFHLLVFKINRESQENLGLSIKQHCLGLFTYRWHTGNGFKIC